MNYTLSTVINFGKYKGLKMTVRDIINSDPRYVDWMMQNFKDCTWDEEVQHALSRAMDR